MLRIEDGWPVRSPRSTPRIPGSRPSPERADRKRPRRSGVLSFQPTSVCLGVAATRGRRTDLLEARAAVHRLVAARLEWHTCLTTAVAAGRREELARATHATAS